MKNSYYDPELNKKYECENEYEFKIKSFSDRRQSNFFEDEVIEYALSLKKELIDELDKNSSKSDKIRCKHIKWIEKNLFVDMVSKPKELPLYIPESLYEKLMQLEWLEERFKTAFAFYYETGCRRSEPFLGELHGNWLLIGGDETKQRIDKELSLNTINLERLTSMRTYFNESYGYKLDSWIGNLSKTFLKAMREVDGQNTKYHLHCLRHTFAVRRYLQTRDIYLVKQELGHSSVVTTEIYAKFSLRRLENDFPSLVNCTKNNENWLNGTQEVGHTSIGVSVSPIISGVSTS